MKVMLVNTRPDWGGGEHWFLWAAEAIAGLAHDVTLIATRASGLASRSASGPLRVLFASRSLPLFLSLRKSFRETRPDIVLCNTGGETHAAVIARGRRPTPKVIFRRGLCKQVHANFIQSLLYRGVNGFICNSLATASLLRESLPWLPAEEPTVLYNPAHILRDPAPEDVASCRRRIGVSEGDLVILNVGRLAPEKGQVILVRAFGELLKQQPNARLIIAGEGPLHSRIERAARDINIADKVVLCGFVRDVAPLYRLADMVVQPSLPGHESFSNSALEALSFGLPVIASTAGGFAELIRDGEDGLLVPHGQVEPLAEAMARLASDRQLRLDIGRAAKAKVARLYSPTQKAAELEAYLAQVLVHS